MSVRPPGFALTPTSCGYRTLGVAKSTGRTSRNTRAAPKAPAGAGIWQVATITFANSGDNIGVYIPVFAAAAAASMMAYISVFLIGVAL
nr:cadmium resistance transporter [Mycolicibacterium porcinum]